MGGAGGRWVGLWKESIIYYSGGRSVRMDEEDIISFDFFALESTPDTTLKATIKIESKMVHSTGIIKRLEDFRRGETTFQVLSGPDFSEAILKVGQREFPCHRVILTNKQGRGSRVEMACF